MLHMHGWLQSLCQATADAVEQMAAHQEFRAERDEAVGILRAQVAQLQALGASRQHELQGTISRLEGGWQRVQAGGIF